MGHIEEEAKDTREIQTYTMDETVTALITGSTKVRDTVTDRMKCNLALTSPEP